MTTSSYNRLKQIVESNHDVVDVGTPAPDETIRDAQDFLELSFPEDYRKFLGTWGTLAVGPCEYYGIAGQDFNRSSIPNGIWFTAVKRKELDFPHNLIIVASHEGDQFICLEVTAGGGSPVVVWDVSTRSVIGKRADDFFEFIIEDIADYI